VCAGSIKGSGAWGRGWETRGRGHIHGGARERFGGDDSDRRGPRNRERERERESRRASERASTLTSGARGIERASVRAEGTGADRSTPPGSERERGKRERGGDDVDRLSRRDGRAGARAKLGRDGPAQLELVFLFP
jgi:hypothetical protein